MKRKKTRRRKTKKTDRSSLLQKTLVLVTCVALALCVASVTYGLFFSHNGGPTDKQSRFMIKILNGTGEPGLAKKASGKLRKMNIDVVEFGNAKNFSYESSVLIARNRNPQIETLGKLLNCENIIEQLKEDEMVDAILILGDDYKNLNIGL
jgi:hypothetical protein